MNRAARRRAGERCEEPFTLPFTNFGVPVVVTDPGFEKCAQPDEHRRALLFSPPPHGRWVQIACGCRAYACASVDEAQRVQAGGDVV